MIVISDKQGWKVGQTVIERVPATLTAWLNYRHNIPASWINSYDKQLRLRDEELYDLKAIPSLYLLDSEKRVMLKDCNLVPQIEEAIYYAEQSKQ